MAGSIAGAVGSSLASAAVGKIFGGGGGFGGSSSGGGAAVGGPAILPFKAGGLKLKSSNNGRLKFKSSKERTALINSIAATYGLQADQLRNIFGPQFDAAFDQGISSLDEQIGQVKPGFGALTEARVNSILNSGKARQSDLRGDLARRRVIGSSFAGDLQNRLALDVAQEEAEARATSFLEELDATNRLVTQRTALSLDAAKVGMENAFAAFGLDRAGDQVKMDEMNLQLNLMSSLVSGATAQLGANGRLEAELAAQSAAGRGSFFGGVPSGVNNLFSASNFGFNTGGQSFFNGGLQNAINSNLGFFGPGF